MVIFGSFRFIVALLPVEYVFCMGVQVVFVVFVGGVDNFVAVWFIGC